MASWVRTRMHDPTPLRHQRITVYPLPDGIVVERDVPIRLADGTVLLANVYRPDVPPTVRHPVLVSVTPYGKDVGVDGYPIDFDGLAAGGNYAGELRVSDHTSFEAPDPAQWVPHGYVLVVADQRGSFTSGGRPRMLLGGSAADAAAVVEWAAAQPWSTGRVGMAGASHLATLQWYTAARRPPHLAAIAPWEGISDPYRDTLCHGGVPDTRFSEFWHRSLYIGSGSAARMFRRIGPWLLRRHHTRCRHLLTAPKLEDVTVPAFVGASWSDQGPRTRGSITGFQRLGSSRKWLYTHGRKMWQTYYSPDVVAAQRRFFDHILTGADNGFGDTPAVRVETRHDLRTHSERYETQWPIAGTRYVPLYLDHATGTLDVDRPAEPSSTRTFPVAGDVLTYTHTFTADTEVTGHTALRLWVQAKDANDMDLFVGIGKIDVDGEDVPFEGHAGSETGPVAQGCIRVSRRALDTEVSTAYRPVVALTGRLPLRRDEIVPVDVEITPHSTFFEAGSSLVLTIAGHDLCAGPVVGHDDTINQGFHIVHTGGQFDSHLLLPVIPDAPVTPDPPVIPAPADADVDGPEPEPAGADTPIVWDVVLARHRRAVH